MFLVKGFLQLFLLFLFRVLFFHGFLCLNGGGLVSQNVRESILCDQFAISARAFGPPDAFVSGIKHHIVAHHRVGPEDGPVGFRCVDAVLVVPLGYAFHVVRSRHGHNDVQGMVGIEVSRQTDNVAGSTVLVGNGLVEGLVSDQLYQNCRVGRQVLLGQLHPVVVKGDSAREGFKVFLQGPLDDFSEIRVRRSAIDNDAAVLVDSVGVP
mmetsp:Transcript_17299/g.37903  ORF Transcript_17299/g.37903 Transcript_17299/m.37903 type:complete len:209 (-) Transcript_17299:1176-1802(-)